jgi:predicted nuclease with TOPRIM domain
MDNDILERLSRIEVSIQDIKEFMVSMRLEHSQVVKDLERMNGYVSDNHTRIKKLESDMNNMGNELRKKIEDLDEKDLKSKGAAFNSILKYIAVAIGGLLISRIPDIIRLLGSVHE